MIADPARPLHCESISTRYSAPLSGEIIRWPFESCGGTSSESTAPLVLLDSAGPQPRYSSCSLGDLRASTAWILDPADSGR